MRGQAVATDSLAEITARETDIIDVWIRGLCARLRIVHELNK
jgi:hypothetical protein